MSVALDESLIYQTKRRTRADALTPEERLALNVLWRKGVRIGVLARVFRVSKNTIYYKSLTGKAKSYPISNRSNSAAETNALVEKLGVKEAERRYLTDEIRRRVNDENARELMRRRRR